MEQVVLIPRKFMKEKKDLTWDLVMEECGVKQSTSQPKVLTAILTDIKLVMVLSKCSLLE